MNSSFDYSEYEKHLRGEYVKQARSLGDEIAKSKEKQRQLVLKKLNYDSEVARIPTPSYDKDWVVELLWCLPGLFVASFIYAYNEQHARALFLFTSLPIVCIVAWRYKKYVAPRNNLIYAEYRDAYVARKDAYESIVNTLASEQTKEISLESELADTILNGLTDRRLQAEQSLINGNQGPLDKKEFVEASRALMEFQRGDAMTIYDEAKIQNDLEALTVKASYQVQGDHIDNRQSVFVNKIDQSSTVHQAPLENSLETEAEVKREILKLIHNKSTNDASIVELIAGIKSDELLIRKSLESLMSQGFLKIGNREDGVICYIIDYLTS